MSPFLKGTLWIVFFALLLAGGFLAYTKWWDAGFLDRVIGEVKGTAVETVQNAADNVVGEVKQGAADYAKQASAGIVSSIGEGLLRFAASIVGESASTTPLVSTSTLGVSASVNPLLSASGTVPAALTSGFLLPPPATTIVTNVGVPLTFSINRGASYEVRWGDGVVDKGTISSDSSRVISHGWAKEGDYEVIFQVKENTFSYSYSFPIRVYNK